MSLDTLLATVRANACLAGPLAITGSLHDGDAITGTAMSAMMAPASATVQALQGQGMLEGRRATLMVADDDVQAALGRDLRTGDTWLVDSGSYIGTWVVDAANPVRGGWHRADVRWERLTASAGSREKR